MKLAQLQLRLLGCAAARLMHCMRLSNASLESISGKQQWHRCSAGTVAHSMSCDVQCE
jgi:hypothetical protein